MAQFEQDGRFRDKFEIGMHLKYFMNTYGECDVENILHKNHSHVSRLKYYIIDITLKFFLYIHMYTLILPLIDFSILIQNCITMKDFSFC